MNCEKHKWKKHPDVDQRFYCTVCGEICYPFDRIIKLEAENATLREMKDNKNEEISYWITKHTVHRKVIEELRGLRDDLDSGELGYRDFVERLGRSTGETGAEG